MNILLINKNPQYTIESKIKSLDTILIDNSQKHFSKIIIKTITQTNNAQFINTKTHINMQYSKLNTVNITS